VTAAVAFAASVAIASHAGSGARPPADAIVQSESALGYEAYTAARLAALRADGRPVFINATAAWCITCLVNERVALSSVALTDAFAEKKVASLKADWTNRDSEVTALLSAQGRSGVPLYLYFAPGAERPVVLPQILTESTLLAQLQR